MENKRLTSLLESLEERVIDTIKYDDSIQVENFDDVIDSVIKNEIDSMEFENDEEKDFFEFVVRENKSELVQNIYYTLY